MADPQRILSMKKAYGATARVSPPLDYAQYQNELVNELLLAPHFRGFPPSREFRRIFWKRVVECLEAEGEEVDERIYEAYLDLLSTRSASFDIRPPSPSYITHFWFSYPEDTTKAQCMQLTTLLESGTMVEGGTTGLRTWGASLEFANWLVKHPDVVDNRRVLELGSGAGFLGLIIATLQMNRLATTCSSCPTLVLSDGNPEVLSRCQQNFRLSCNHMSSHPSLEFRLLDWSDALDSEGRPDPASAINELLQSVDTVIGADLIYDPTIVPALTAVLVLFFRAKRKENSGSCAYIAMTVRREQTVSAFLSSLSLHHLQSEEIDMQEATASQKQFLDGVEDAANCTVKLIKILSAG